MAAQLEPTHLGEVFDRGVLRARRRLKAEGGADYDLVRDHLDPIHYLLQAPGLFDRPRLDLVGHYLTGEGRRPSPDPHFSQTAYLTRHPHRRTGGDPYVAWLREGRTAGEIADPAAGIDEPHPCSDCRPVRSPTRSPSAARTWSIGFGPASSVRWWPGPRRSSR